MKTLKKSTAFYKDPSTGDFKSLNVIGEKTAAELKAEIEAKGQETLESIPDDYTALSEEVSQLSSEIDNYDKSVKMSNLLDEAIFTEGKMVNVEEGYLWNNEYWDTYTINTGITEKIIVKKNNISAFHINVVFYNGSNYLSGNSYSNNTNEYELIVPEGCNKINISFNVHDDELEGLKVNCVTEVGNAIFKNREDIEKLYDMSESLVTTNELLLDADFYEFPKVDNYEEKYAFSQIDGKPNWQNSKTLKTYSFNDDINVKAHFTKAVDDLSTAIYLASFTKYENEVYTTKTFNVNDLFLYNQNTSGNVYGIAYEINVVDRVITFNGYAENVIVAVTMRRESGYVEYSTLRNPKWLLVEPNEIFVASSNATKEEKEVAHYICDGVNDEIEINRALKKLGRHGTVRLSSGTFNIESFTEYNANDERTAIFTKETSFELSIKGCSRRNGYGTVLFVSGEVLEQIQDNEQVNVISGYGNGSTFNVENVQFKLANNQHPIVCYNGANLGAGYLHDIVAYASENNETATQTIPNEKCVAFRSYHGDDNGTQTIWKSLIAIGFGRAFQLGGEHHILLQCTGRYNYCTFTFGEYPVKLGNAFSHPITLINCCDEHQCLLPQFYKCGAMVETDTEGHPLQEVDFISFNIERWNDWKEQQLCAREVTAGDFCGRIEYTMNGVTPSAYETWTATKNLRHAKFWENGSGLNFITRNMTHRLGGTTELRRTYLPNYMQEYYDTDLKKKLIYDGTNWVDLNGAVIN